MNIAGVLLCFVRDANTWCSPVDIYSEVSPICLMEMLHAVREHKSAALIGIY